MPPRDKTMTAALKKFKEYVSSPDIHSILQELEIQDMHESSDRFSTILSTAQSFHEAFGTVDGFLRHSLNTFNTDGLFKELVEKRRIYKAAMSTGTTHRDKRRLVNEFNFRMPEYCIKDLLLKETPADVSVTSHQHPAIKIVFRERVTKAIKRRVWMWEDSIPKGEDLKRAELVGETTGFYIADPNTSIIFLSGTPDDWAIELCVLRNIGTMATQSAELFDWLEKVVDDACSERRDIRPNHPGKMVQVGLNMGSRHARVLGWAVSYTKKLSEVTKTCHDEDVIGAVSFIWNLLSAHLPQEILKMVEKSLEEAGVPRLATRNIAPGKGFSIELGGKTYTFSDSIRSPPETYLSRGYTAWVHTDPAYCEFAFDFTVSKNLNTTKVIGNGGGNFVERSLRVLVPAAAGTVIVFKPAKPHGTTVPRGAVKRCLTVAFSRRIADALADLRSGQETAVVSGDGAGEGQLGAEIKGDDEDDYIENSV